MRSELRVALADDLDQLIRLHDRELDAATVDALRAADFPGGLALLPDEASGRAAAAALRAALAAPEGLDDLAADYAGIYLNNQFGTSPYESVWLSDDHLACAAPMFELRGIYAAAGWRAADRRRFDDHFVFQLGYLRVRLDDPAVDAGALADFIDEHVGYWFPDFARRVAALCGTAFYAALAALTAAWIIRCRQLLGTVGNRPPADPAAIAARIDAKLARDKAEAVPLRFMPGAQGPGW